MNIYLYIFLVKNDIVIVYFDELFLRELVKVRYYENLDFLKRVKICFNF